MFPIRSSTRILHFLIISVFFGVPTFYDRYDGVWHPCISLKKGNVGIANAGDDTITSMKQAAEFGLTTKQRLVGLILGMNGLPALT